MCGTQGSILLLYAVSYGDVSPVDREKVLVQLNSSLFALSQGDTSEH